ncbi:MAG: 6-phosphogluconolactonase [Chlamydiales bacterium]
MKEPLHFVDKRRIITLPGDVEATLHFSVQKWIEVAQESIDDHGFFAVALSGGSTPKNIFKRLSESEMASKIDWSKVFLFWSDERSVPPDHTESNYHMAMEEGGLGKLGIPSDQIFRMVAETDIEANAEAYEKIILETLGGRPFDLVMLGMGDDGHTASLFPHTKALTAIGQLVVANHVFQKNTWRMTLTYECINRARYVCVYVIGKNKAKTLEKVLTSPFNPENYPSQLIGTAANRAIWIIDDEAGSLLLSHFRT